MAFQERGKHLFELGTSFAYGVRVIEDLPLDRLQEIAFAGRSNVGKSSLINAVVGTTIARASNTPGRTQELNFFKVASRFYLVDLPGYGYASAPKKTVEIWTRLIHDYLRGRKQLKRVFLLIDARHGIKKVDENIMKMLDSAAVSYKIILTKADKVKTSELDIMYEQVVNYAKTHVACYPEILITSSENGKGIADLRGEIYKVVEGL